MNLIDEKITHKVFGEGNIVAHDESIITIDFKEDTKDFIFPDAFKKFITLNDQSTANSLKEVLSKRKAEEEVLEKERQEKKEQQLAEQQHREKMKNHKIHESSQIAFWLDQEEQENVFNDWQVYTGTVKSGKSEGQPNKIARLHPNSAALLTVREPDQSEADRRIVGLYMANKMLPSNMKDDGMVPSHEEFRIKLTDQEAEKMLFWNYYINNNSPNRTTWNSGKYRYFDNVGTAQILKDIIALKTDEEEIKHVESFLEYFCRMNLLQPDSIPEANGALKQ